MTDENVEHQSPQPSRPLPRWLRMLLLGIGFVLVPIGALGIFLPVLPGVPLLILAAACFARSSPRFERWLVTHPLLGPGIENWRKRGAISKKAKAIAISMMTLSALIVGFADIHLILKSVIWALLISGAAFVATRPER